MKKLIPAVTLFVALAACGGGGGGRPSTSEIADALKSGDSAFSQVTDASDEAIDCVAKALHDSDVSDEALQALVDGDESYEGTDEDKAAAEAASGDLAKCVTAS